VSLAFIPPPDPLVLVVPPADEVEVEVINAPTDAPLTALAHLYQKEVTEKKNGKKNLRFSRCPLTHGRIGQNLIDDMYNAVRG
jgi:hypothetical protein